jgi:hypothetical protein
MVFTVGPDRDLTAPKDDGLDAPAPKIDVSIVRVLFAGKSAPSGLNSRTWYSVASVGW